MSQGTEVSGSKPSMGKTILVAVVTGAVVAVVAVVAQLVLKSVLGDSDPVIATGAAGGAVGVVVSMMSRRGS
jgi:zinc transporter ZupT